MLHDVFVSAKELKEQGCKFFKLLVKFLAFSWLLSSYAVVSFISSMFRGFNSPISLLFVLKSINQPGNTNLEKTKNIMFIRPDMAVGGKMQDSFSKIFVNMFSKLFSQNSITVLCKSNANDNRSFSRDVVTF